MDVQAVGIDLGGTWIRLRAIDRHGKIVRSYKDHAPTPQDLSPRLRSLWQQWKIRPYHLHVATRGVWTPHERRRLIRSLKGLAKQVTVISDVEAAWLSAFERDESGILVIAGTGSIAFGRHRGKVARTGGLGPYLGDEGSGFWIGREWLKRQAETSQGLIKTLEFLHHLSSSPVRDIAALTTHVLAQAARGNRTARAIVSDAQQHLALTVLQTAKSLSYRRSISVSWTGSLLDNAAFRRGFSRILRRLSRTHKIVSRLVKPNRDPIDALLYDND